MRLILSVLFTTFILQLGAQDPFCNARATLFQQACDQWLVSALRSSNPAYFKGSTKIASPADRFKIAGIQTEYTPDQEAKFREVYIPKGNADRFLALVSLSHLYFPLMERKLSNAKIPVEFKYLPLVMTGFNQHYHDSRDRAGMWALDYLVARKWDLRIDTLLDERRGGDLTTDAAVKELKSIHDHFNGNNEAVLKAWYISRAYAEKWHNKKTLTVSAIDEEADEFVAFFVYTVRLFHQNQTILSNQLNNYFDILGNYENIAFKDTVNVDALVQLVGISKNEIYQANPVYTGQFIDPMYRRTTFILDNRYSGKFHSMEDSIYRWAPPAPVVPIAQASEWIEEEDRVYHVVRKGESLGIIARKHKVSVSNLKKWNKLKSDKIRAGQRLTIIKKTRKRAPKPEPGPEVPNNAPVIGDSTSVVITLADTTAKKVTPPPPQPKEKPKTNKPKETVVTYTVKSGDSLWTIAKKYKVTPEQIMKWNKCGEKIRPGQKLKIHTKKK
jgi:membrane-bound lytic murein transglycosylase D